MTNPVIPETLNPDPLEIHLDPLVELLRKRGMTDAYVEQTGGGCATVYVLGGRIQAGPGWFAGPGWSDGRATLDDFYLGWDSDDRDAGETATQKLAKAGSVDDVVDHIVERIAWYVEHVSECPSFTYGDEPGAYGEDS